MRTKTAIKVRYAETDKMGVVYHANYLVYFEVARTDFLAQQGFDWAACEDLGYVSPVLEVSAKYLSPLRYGDEAIVETWISALKPTKVEYTYYVYANEVARQKGKPAVTGTTSHCLVTTSTGKPVSMKKALPHLYSLYESVLESNQNQ